MIGRTMKQLRKVFADGKERINKEVLYCIMKYKCCFHHCVVRSIPWKREAPPAQGRLGAPLHLLTLEMALGGWSKSLDPQKIFEKLENTFSLM